MDYIDLRKTTKARWQAEFMQQVLAAQYVPNLVLDIGTARYSDQGNQCALQVLSQDRANCIATS